MKTYTGRTLARLGSLVSVLAVSIAVPVTFASAAAPQADVTIAVPTSSVIYNGTIGKYYPIRLHNNSDVTAEGVTVAIDARGIDSARVEVTLPPDGNEVCHDGTVAGTFLCRLAWLGGQGNYDIVLKVRALPDAAPGPAGSLVADLTARNAPARSVTRELSVLPPSPPQVDLVTFAQDVYDDQGQPVAPGGTGHLAFAVFNHGNAPATGLVVELALPSYVAFDSLPVVCAPGDNNTTATCTLPSATVLQPGSVLTSADAFSLKVGAGAPGPISLAGGSVIATARATAPTSRTTAPAAPPTGFRISQATNRQAAEAVQADNTALFTVFVGAGSTDLAISATQASGALGSTVSVRVTVDNTGPASALGTVVTVVAPSGTELVNVDRACVAVTAGRKYTCDLGTYPVGSGYGEFSFKITSATTGADGLATVASRTTDTNAANNSAKITIGVGPAAGGGTGGGGGTGLPVTGAKAGVIVAVGVLALLCGAGVVVMNRRRRVVMVTPEQDGNSPA